MLHPWSALFCVHCVQVQCLSTTGKGPQVLKISVHRHLCVLLLVRVVKGLFSITPSLHLELTEPSEAELHPGQVAS